MTIKQSSLEINLKTVIAVVTIFSMVAGGAGSWAVMSNETETLKDKMVAMNTLMKEIAADNKAEIMRYAGEARIAIASHASNTDQHMPFAEKVRQFVSREEMTQIRDNMDAMDERQRTILSALTRIESQLESIAHE